MNVLQYVIVAAHMKAACIFAADLNGSVRVMRLDVRGIALPHTFFVQDVQGKKCTTHASPLSGCTNHSINKNMI